MPRLGGRETLLIIQQVNMVHYQQQSHSQKLRLETALFQPPYLKCLRLMTLHILASTRSTFACKGQLGAETEQTGDGVDLSLLIFRALN